MQDSAFPVDPRPHGPVQQTFPLAAPQRVEQSVWSPETDRVWSLRNIYATTRLIFGELTPGLIVSIKHEIERGRLTRMADLHSRMLTTDAVVNVAYRIRRGAVAGRPVRVKPAKLDPRRDAGRQGLAEAAANLADLIVQRTEDLELTAMKQLGAIGDGIAVAETVWKRERGTWMPTHVPVQTREVWLDFDWTPMVRDPGYQFHRCADHPGKFWTHEPSVQPGPFGDQMGFAAAIWPWIFKVFAIKFWMGASERYGSPLAIGKILPGAQVGTDTQGAESMKQALLTDLKQLMSDSVAVTSGGTDIDIKPAAAASSSALFKELIDWLDKQIMLAILGSPDLLMPGPNGSRAATQTRDGLRLETSASDARFLWSSYRRDVIAWALKYNGLGDAPLPIIETIFSDDIPAISAADCAVPAFSIDDVRASHGLPEWGPEKGGDKIAQAIVVRESVDPTQAPGGAPAAPPFAPPAPAPANASPARGGMPDLSRKPAPYR